jgi:uncharacterized protein (DUF1684 family)
MHTDEWKEGLEKERRQKDLFFASHPQSPLPPVDRLEFQGLVYWPPDPEYRFELELRRHEDSQVIEVGDTGGQTRELWKWGEFRFELGGEYYTLEAYKSKLADERLFVPFRDATSGKESYGAGRYLDLEAEKDRTADGLWILDFNEAYNPWCAYSKNYVCPFTPPENRLTVPVRAGEKQYATNE